MKRLGPVFGLLLILPLTSPAQDEVMLTLDGKPFMRSEFERIYHKNNTLQGLDNKTPAAYLELYINFRLKVHEAEKLGYDTAAQFRSELAGYRDQLAQPYLQDRALIDSLLREAYFRTVNEINASHIMAKLPPNPTPGDTVKAYNRILDIRKRILAGESFETVAREESDDKANGGQLGWFSAFAMVFPFEDAAYRLQVGELSQPVRTRYGYHVIRLNGIRPSQGEIKLAHIMVRVIPNDTRENLDRASEQILAAYHLLQQGIPFTEVVKQYSEDPGSARSGGQLRWLRSGELPPSIEEVVFLLRDSGDYTAPLQSDYGWHIFRLEGKRPIPPFDQLKGQLEQRIMADERGKLASESFLTTLKKEYGLITYPENISALVSHLDSSVYSGNWSIAAAGDLIEPVFEIDHREYSQQDLVAFLLQTHVYRREESLSSIVDRKCNELINKILLSVEKDHLEEKYPDFSYLMEEYHDGILLFNIMEDQVWNKAIADSAGLRAFHAQHEKDYVWPERASVSVYTFSDSSLLALTRKLARKRVAMKLGAADMVSKICGSDTLACVEVADRLYEKGDPAPEGKFEWKKGYVTVFRENRLFKVLAVNQILPPAVKSFDEIRGQVTADYQNFLDRQWIGVLREKYPVVINEAAIQNIR